MSLHKAIEAGKEHRKPYTDSRAVDGSCRGKKGGCPWCKSNRTHQGQKIEQAAAAERELITEPE